MSTIGNKVVRLMLLYFVGAQSQDVLLLDQRFRCTQGKVWWVSIKNNWIRGNVMRAMLHRCFVANLKYVVLLEHRFRCFQGQVLWVSVNNNGSMSKIERKVVRLMLLCFAGAHWQDVLLLDHRFCWSQV
jgi:hypothetical protein